MARMAFYFEKVQVRLVTGDAEVDVIAHSVNQAEAVIRSEAQGSELLVSEEQLRDVLFAMKKARQAAKVADVNVPYTSREE